MARSSAALPEEPGKPEERVSTLDGADIEAATAVLLASHGDYPAFRSLWPRPGSRRRALLPFLRAGVADAAAFRASSVAWSDTAAVAVALWLPPGAFPWSPRRKRATPALLRTAVAAPRSFPRFTRIGSSAERSHPQEPHWYLETLGVHPATQRRGWGQRILTPRLQQADDDGVPCYVETSDTANVPFYRLLGFEVTAAELRHLPGGPAYVGMWRRPR